MTNYNAMEYIKQAVCPRLKEGEIYTFRFLENAEGREKHVKKKECVCLDVIRILHILRIQKERNIHTNIPMSGKC